MCTKIAIELIASPLPKPTGLIADHHWLLVHRGSLIDRWEVWQYADVGGVSWGHLHLNLQPAMTDMGNGAAELFKRWQGAEAEELVKRIESAPTTYPYRDLYRYWPGPNSNTFAQWVLQDEFQLGRRGFGRNYPQS